MTSDEWLGLKFLGESADGNPMTINGSYSSTVLAGLDRSGGDGTEAGVALLKKAQDQAKAQAEALISGIEQSTPKCQGDCGQHLDAYA